MNFCVYEDSGAEIHGYFVPDGYSTKPRILVRIGESSEPIEIYTWVFIEGAKAQGAHETGNVGFVLTNDNVPGLGSTQIVELSDPNSGLVFYRRAQPGQYIEKKVLRIETCYVPQSEIDLSLKDRFQFFADRVEHFGFETIRQMIEIMHQSSAYIAGRILLKNVRMYIDYNIDITMISLRDPFYELAIRLIIFSRMKTQRFKFVPERDRTLFQPVVDLLHGQKLNDERSLRDLINNAPKSTLNLLSSPFTQQLVAANPTDVTGLQDVSQALDVLSQFTLFDSGRDESTYSRHIAEIFGLPIEAIGKKKSLEQVHLIADILRTIGRAEHILEADLILFHFIHKAESKIRYPSDS